MNMIHVTAFDSLFLVVLDINCSANILRSNDLSKTRGLVYHWELALTLNKELLCKCIERLLALNYFHKKNCQGRKHLSGS